MMKVNVHCSSEIDKREDRLRYLYIATSGLCALMVCWILVMPSTWLLGRSKLHDDILANLDPHGITPPEALLKYRGHTAVHLTHVLPGAFWAGLVPFQLHPKFRKTQPKLHRIFGYAFLACSLLMGLGLAIIMQRGLFYENFFNDLPPSQSFGEPASFALGVYFVGTAVYAVKCAIKRRFASHQRWIVRHISSGIWVALQRFLLVTFYQVIFPSPVSRETQRNSFGQATYIATVICLALGEYAVYLLDQRKVKRVD
jgi:hypothetical protein